MIIRQIVAATALVAFAAVATPVSAQDKPASDPNIVLNEWGFPAKDEYGNTVKRDPEMLNPSQGDGKLGRGTKPEQKQ